MKAAGTHTPGHGRRPDIFAITDVSGDIKADHVKRVFTVLGTLDKGGLFEARSAMFVLQEFHLDAKDGNWHIDQWMVSTDIYGEVKQTVHLPAIVTPDGEPLRGSPREPNNEPQPTPDNSEIQTQFDAMLKYWAERKPEGA